MRIIKPGFEILDIPASPDEYPAYESSVASRVERAGRVCYKSEHRMTDDTGPGFVRALIKSGHESVIEHVSLSVRVVCDRGVSHEWVRHRIASYSQESTRYCNYGRSKFGGEITFIKPCYWDEDGERFAIWRDAMRIAERAYLDLLRSGSSPQEARGVLPNSVKTELISTMNLREWRHFFKLRADKSAHPQMLELTRPMLDAFKRLLPCVFEDINP
ncbi:MAG: FAD-dependent thymidylate synthase [Oscillospiraceae bacterium]|jgi:thymidylate synthase (FAD)|nr:FAD-dependent thymidylate synthase [Oscillospiraceae bacterium]